MIYHRNNARVNNTVKLARKFYNGSVLFDPYQIAKVEIWRRRYDIETPELLEDIVYGSKIIMYEIDNDAYGVLGFASSTETSTQVVLMNYEENFTNETDFIVNHQLDDDRVTVTVFDNTGSEVQPDEVIAIDEDNVRIKFGIAMSGTVDILGTKIVNTETSVLVNKYEENITSPGLSFTINHNLNDDQPLVTAYNTSAQYIKPDDITVIDANSVQVTFASTFSGIITVIGGNAGYSKTGFGSQAEAVGTRNGCMNSNCGQDAFAIFAGQNDQLLLSVDGNDETIMLSPGIKTMTDILVDINTQWTLGEAEDRDGYLVLKSNEYGTNHTLELKAIVGQAYDTFGLTMGLVAGLGVEPAYMAGTISELFDIDTLTNMLKIQINDYEPVIVTLSTGTGITAAAIAAEINAVFVTNSIPAVAGINGAGRVTIRVTEMTGIVRDGVGSYYVNYAVPDNFLDQGVVSACFTDVWFYMPDSSYASFIPDDTCIFKVYAEDYFVDCGGNNFDYFFSLANKFFIKGEKVPIRGLIEVLPRTDTPEINNYIIPLFKSKYTIQSITGDEVVAYTDVDDNTGTELRVHLDTTLFQAGQYRIRFKVQLPNNEVTMSDWLVFQIAGEVN